MAEGVIPQTVIVLRHRIRHRAAGMVAVGDEAGDDARGLMAHNGTISVERVKECVLAFGGRNNEGSTVAEGVKVPIIAVILLTQKVEPGEYR